MNIGGAVSELIKLMQPTNEDEMMMMSQQSGRGMGQRGGGMRYQSVCFILIAVDIPNF